MVQEAMLKILETKLISEFQNKESFTREDLFAFFQGFEPDLKEGTFGWRIFDLKKKNVISSVGRGIYKISYKSAYCPPLSQNYLKFAKFISTEYEDIKYCLWETAWLNEFSQHQPVKRFTIVEIEKEFAEALYFKMMDEFKCEIYLNPSDKEINFNIAGSKSSETVIIKNLLTRSPITKRTEKKVKFNVPLLEKMLVDLFVEDRLLYFYQGSELVYIFENAIKNYSLNFTKLFSYARRRKVEREMKAFLNSSLHHVVRDFLE